MSRPHNQDDPPADAGLGESRVRLQKLMAKAGLGSRRACERMIEDGLVRVNGMVSSDLPILVDPASDRIEVRGRRLQWGEGPRSQRKVYVMLYKPRRTLTTLSDPEGRRTVGDLVQHPSQVRLYPVGRLDYDTMGLVLMTNDGELANRLTHPRYGVHKTYRAIVRGALREEEIDQLEEGIFLTRRKSRSTTEASRTTPAGIEIVRREAERTILDITLREGRNRQVRRMLARVGCPVRKLVRIRMGPLRLKGVRMGEWRELRAGEVAALRRAARLPSSGAERAKGVVR